MRFSSLDDGSVLEILTRVGAADARDLARCRRVSKRCRELGWVVPSLVFYFDVEDAGELRDKEFALSNILRDTRRAAPGCLKALKVTFNCMEQSQVAGPWLVYAADSVVELELELVIHNETNKPQYGPAVWTSLWGFKALKRLKMANGYFRRQVLPVINELPFKNLTSCHTYATSELISALCAACPVLEHLSITDFRDGVSPVEVASQSLESFELQASHFVLWTEVTLSVRVRSPRLARLQIGVFGGGVELLIMSQTAKSLSRLELGGPCVVRCEGRFDKISGLNVHGKWESDAFMDLLKLTAVVTDVTIETLQLKDVPKIPFGQVFGRFINLTTVCLCFLEGFEVDDTELDLEAVAVHVLLFGFDDHYHILKHFLDVYRVGVLVVHAMNGGYSSLQALVDAHPSRVFMKDGI